MTTPLPSPIIKQIQTSALAVFEKKGFAGTTMNDIAAEAGVNVAIIYRHFAGKRELFASLGRPELDFPDEQERQNRAHILHCALQIFGMKGYDAATMDDIAAAAGLSKAGVYFYFPSKENLFLAALENPAGFSSIRTAMERISSADHPSLEEVLTETAKAYLSIFADEDTRSLLKVILSEGVRNPRIAHTFKEKVIGAGSRMMTGYLAPHCILESEALTAKIQIFFGMLFSWGLSNCLLAECTESIETDINQIAGEYARQFLFGIQAHYDL